MKLTKEQADTILNAFDKILINTDDFSQIDTIPSSNESRKEANQLIDNLNIHENRKFVCTSMRTTDTNLNPSPYSFKGFTATYKKEDNVLVPEALIIMSDNPSVKDAGFQYDAVEFL